MQNAEYIQLHLAEAAEAAHQALQSVCPHRDAFLTTLRRFESAVRASEVGASESASSATFDDATKAFRTRYDDLRRTLRGLVAHTSKNLAKAYSDFERDASFVTIMLFGRTKAGKSTTMEALTGGDGASIGVGRQNTTTEVRAYYFPPTDSGEPPNGPALRIVDTPGIDGFEGEQLAAMAEEFVDRSDHILFLLTDDKATADELERFRMIRTQGKGLTVLLNVKAADEDLDLLLSRPDLIFKKDEIDGHSRRISGYLERRFDMPPPRLIPVHARAAWLGRSDAELPDGVDSRDSLVRNSRVLDVEQRIVEFIRNDALPARLCAPRDLLLSHLWPLKDVLRPFAGEFRQMMGTLDHLTQRLEMGAEQARQKAAHRLPMLRARFQAASDAMPGLVDSTIACGGRAHTLNDQWKQFLIVHGVADSTTWFVRAAQHDFETELAEEARTASFDYQFAKVDDLDRLLSEYHDAESSSRRNKYARAGLRTAGGLSVGALATWAVANWWNPTGWFAAAAAVVVVGAGIAGEEVARVGTDKWEGAEKRRMHEKRDEIIATLNKRIWEDYAAVLSRCEKWLEDTKARYVTVANHVAQPVRDAARQLWQATVACLDQLDDVADPVNTGLVIDLFKAFIPECESGEIQVHKVVRSPGYRTKVIVYAAPGCRKNAMASCLGHHGSRIRSIAHALGGERVDLVDGGAGHEAQILQALGQPKSRASSITLATRGEENTAYVVHADRSQVGATVGPHGANIRLAKKLFGINIILEGAKA